MTHLVKDLARSANATLGSDLTIAGDDCADWVNDVYRDRVASGDIPNHAQKVFERHARSRQRCDPPRYLGLSRRGIRFCIAEGLNLGENCRFGQAVSLRKQSEDMPGRATEGTTHAHMVFFVFWMNFTHTWFTQYFPRFLSSYFRFYCMFTESCY
ncbi:hypothetical protein EDB87DRAFT_1131432 [Lactarius vividus]|nr:hypothetical protein EDB87DRAFT_1131432 [Lactarius vividus]